MKHEQETTNRREFLVKGAGVGLAAVGSGMLYKSWTLRPDYSHTPARAQDGQEGLSSPEALSEPPTRTDGTLVITQEQRLGEVYLDRLSQIYHKFEPFGPYGYVIVGQEEKVEAGTIRVKPETVMAPDAPKQLASLFAKSLIRNTLERGENYKALTAYAQFMRLMQREVSADSVYDQDDVQTALTILNPEPERGNGYRDDPLEAFATITAALYNASDAVKEQILALPTDSIDDSSGYPMKVDSAPKYLCKAVLEPFLETYETLLPEEMGNGSKDRCLDTLFYKIGLLRYDLFRS